MCASVTLDDNWTATERQPSSLPGVPAPTTGMRKPCSSATLCLTYKASAWRVSGRCQGHPRAQLPPFPHRPRRLPQAVPPVLSAATMGAKGGRMNGARGWGPCSYMCLPVNWVPARSLERSTPGVTGQTRCISPAHLDGSQGKPLLGVLGRVGKAMIMGSSVGQMARDASAGCCR